jgi:hypothetical protein
MMVDQSRERNWRKAVGVFEEFQLLEIYYGVCPINRVPLTFGRGPLNVVKCLKRINQNVDFQKKLQLL